MSFKENVLPSPTAVYWAMLDSNSDLRREVEAVKDEVMNVKLDRLKWIIQYCDDVAREKEKERQEEQLWIRFCAERDALYFEMRKDEEEEARHRRLEALEDQENSEQSSYLDYLETRQAELNQRYDDLSAQIAQARAPLNEAIEEYEQAVSAVDDVRISDLQNARAQLIANGVTEEQCDSMERQAEKDKKDELTKKLIERMGIVVNDETMWVHNQMKNIFKLRGHGVEISGIDTEKMKPLLDKGPTVVVKNAKDKRNIVGEKHDAYWADATNIERENDFSQTAQERAENAEKLGAAQAKAKKRHK